MIKSVTVKNHLGESLKIELRFPEKSGFLVQEITGLGPSKANINSTELSTGDGSLFNSARVNSRNIVLNLKLLDNPTIEHTRQKSYKYFPIKKRVELLFETDNRTCVVYGYVESNEPNIFSKQENTLISILCPDPYFYSAGEDGNNITVFSGIESVFTFPFSNNSLTQNLLNMGNIITNQEQTIYYEGDSDIGVKIYIHAIGDVTNLAIYNLTKREVMKIDSARLVTLTGSSIIAGDDIFISTIRGGKYIQLLRNGVYINILNCLGKDVDWFQLSKGDNIFAFAADFGVTNLQVRVENQTVYEGV